MGVGWREKRDQRARDAGIGRCGRELLRCHLVNVLEGEGFKQVAGALVEFCLELDPGKKGNGG